MEAQQIIIKDGDLNNTQRVSIYHHGHRMNDTFSGRALVVDGRVLFKEKRFSTFGEADMIKFAQRTGFEDIRSFFDYYDKLTSGGNFYGIIKFNDGFRWFADLNFENEYQHTTIKQENIFTWRLPSEFLGSPIIYWFAALFFVVVMLLIYFSHPIQ